MPQLPLVMIVLVVVSCLPAKFEFRIAAGCGIETDFLLQLKNKKKGLATRPSDFLFSVFENAILC